MSIWVNHDHRYTPEEEAYLSDRSKDWLIAVNKRKFGDGEPVVVPKTQQPQDLSEAHHELSEYPLEIQDEVKGLTVAELKTELDSVEVEYQGDARKHELQLLLAAAWVVETE